MEVLSFSLFSKIKPYPFNYVSANRAGCIYLPRVEKRNLKNNKEYDNCTLKSKDNIDQLINEKNNSIIVIGGDYKDHFSDNSQWKYIAKNNQDIMSSFKNSLFDSLEKNKIILIYPIPSVKFDVVKKIMNEVPKNTFNTTEYLKKNPFTTSYEDYLKQNKKILDFFDNISHPNLYKIYPDKIFCDKLIEKKCFTHEGKNIFYSDKHHLALSGAEKITNKILELILKIEKIN